MNINKQHIQGAMMGMIVFSIFRIAWLNLSGDEIAWYLVLVVISLLIWGITFAD